MTDVSAIAHLRCPAPLRDLAAWVCWRYEPNDNPGGKPRKVPYYAAGGKRHGRQGAPEDTAQLVTFDAARAAAARRKMDGVGFCTLPEFGIVALDFDGCLVNGEPHPDLLPILASTYVEYSPSGTGLRALYRGQLGDLKSHGAPYGLEVFSSKGYVTITGHALDAVELLGNTDTVAELDAPAIDLIRARFKRDAAPAVDAGPVDPLGLTDAQLAQALDALPVDLDYDTWLSVGMALHHERGSDGFDLWDTWSQRSPKYTTREYGWDRWRSFGRGNGAPVTIRSLVHLANEHGAGLMLNGPASPAEFEAAVQAPVAGTPARFQPVPIGEFAGRAPPRWIVKGVLPQAELVVLFGESGSGKSFVALDLAMAIALGLPWRERRVRQGRVVYIAAEGAGGFRNRCVAYAAAKTPHALDPAIPFDVIPDAPNLLLKDDALAVAKAIGRADVVIVDTFAQVTPGGNENAGEDMGKALAHCKGIHRTTGALVVLVHHSGKDASKGARGWSGLRAAADAELEVIRQPTGRMMRTSKQKDGDDGLAWGFGLDVVTIGVDEDGDPITSCVVVDQALPVAGLARVLGPTETIVNAVVQDFAGAQSAGIEVNAVVTEAAKRMDSPEKGKRDTRKQRALRALRALCTGDGAPYGLDDDDTTITIM